MNEYAVVKTVHVISSTLLFGTGLHRDPRVAYFVVRYVVIADWLFTMTAVIVQPVMVAKPA